MTEKQWLRGGRTSDPRAMLYALEEQFPAGDKVAKRARERKLRLFGCAACRRLWHLFALPETRALVEVVERFADGDANRRQLAAAHKKARGAQQPEPPDDEEWSPIYGAYDYAIRAADNLGDSPYVDQVTIFVQDLFSATVNDPDNPEEEHIHQKALLLDIFANPFRPVTFAPEWRTDTAVAIARGMYESRDFGAMPILADALEDAGCAADEVLTHCRDATNVHVRGCWVVDSVLGKT